MSVAPHISGSPRAAEVTACDIAIIGGGMVGASLALALAPTRLRVLLVEGVAPDADSQPSFDQRTTALGNGSRRIFEALGAWERLACEAAPIRAIHVSDAGRFGFARLEAGEQGVEALGYVVPNRAIGAALWARLEESGERVMQRVPARPRELSVGPAGACFVLDAPARAPETVSARLLVAADGAQSAVREAAGIGSRIEDYGQVAVVANVAADRPHDGTAYERFTATGPLAVLPLYDGSWTVVWTLAPDRARTILALEDAAFLRELQACFGWRAGRWVRVGRRNAYSLALTRAEDTIATRTVLIGNAAQSLHPVAGQGFNLGLRDAAALAEVLARAAEGDVGAPAVLEEFRSWRAADRRGVVQFTDGLVKLFRDSRPGVGLARNVGLLVFDLLPPAKSALARVSWGFAGRLPRLASGRPLT